MRARARRAGRPSGGRGFTLLEMMIAVAILSGALTWIVVGMSRNIRAENAAKLMTTATFLAREKMVDLEDELYEKGFGDFEKEVTGSFDDKGFARFSWRAIVDKVELPTAEQMQTVLGNAQQARQSLAGGSTDTTVQQQAGAGASNSPLGMGAGALSSQFGVIKDVLEQAIRRVTIKIGWWEGRKPREVELVAYYVDVRRVDQAILIGTAAATGQGQPGAPGSGTTPATGAGTGTTPAKGAGR